MNIFEQPGFQAGLALGRGGRAVVKLSGFQNFSDEAAPHRDCGPFVAALLDAFGLDACVGASDWPFLKATQRLDHGPLLNGVEAWLPDAGARRRVLWDTPCRLIGFDPAPALQP